MTELKWDLDGERLYETGVDRGVLYKPTAGGVYTTGYAWNGLVNVTESPSGAESNKQYADNMVYVNLKSSEEFAFTLEAFMYPPQFAECDGTAMVNGVGLGQQRRSKFGFSYRTLIGNDIVGEDHGYKIHLVYGCEANVSERANATINESPEAVTFSWEVEATKVAIGVIAGTAYRPTAHLTISSLDHTPAKMTMLEDILYGRSGAARLPSPAEVISLFSGAQVNAVPTAPTYAPATKTITIPTVTGVDYRIDGKIVGTPTVVITKDTEVVATPRQGYIFPVPTDNEWVFKFA